ncbi:MAG: hypothetical protein KG003_15900 [Bacteroidetes bacterium]|nr:hypothetical protein [Bacteroidota bacterium]
MTKLSLFALAMFAGSLTLNAQKVDLDPYNFKFQYRNLPSTPLDTTYKTYSVKTDVSADIENAMTADAVSSKIILEGFSRVDRKGDVSISISVEDLIIEKYDIIENSTETKNKDGSVTKNYSYYVAVTYSIRGRADFYGRDGSELKKGMSLFSSSYNWNSSSYKTRSEASSYYYNNKRAIMNNLIRERINEAIGSINGHVNLYFGYPVTDINNYLWLIDNKKHPEYEAMNARWKALKLVLEGITANELSEDAKSKINEMIKYFDGLKTTYNKDEKADKKIRYACYYNNAQLYMILDMPDKAGIEGNGLITNDYDAKDGKRINEAAEALTALFTANHWNSRHFKK